jgi:hypothetical protein
VDKANERFALPGFVEGVEVYRDVVRRLVLDEGDRLTTGVSRP